MQKRRHRQKLRRAKMLKRGLLFGVWLSAFGLIFYIESAVLSQKDVQGTTIVAAAETSNDYEAVVESKKNAVLQAKQNLTQYYEETEETTMSVEEMQEEETEEKTEFNSVFEESEADTSVAEEETGSIAEEYETTVEEAVEVTTAEETTTEKTTTEEETTIAVTAMSSAAWVTSKANVRSGPGTNYSVLGTYASGQKVTITGKTGSGWYRVNYNGSEAYIHQSMLTFSDPTEETTTTTKASSDSDSSAKTIDVDDTPTGNSYNGIYEGDVITGQATHYCACSICCGKSDGITASGIKVQNGVYTTPGVVACNWLPLGTIIDVDGEEYIVADRGGSGLSSVGRIDIFTPGGHQAALNAGRHSCTITIISIPD